MSVIQQRYRIGGQNGKSQLRGIHLTFSDASDVTIGMQKDKYLGALHLDYDKGESVTYLSIYGNGAGTRCGAFHIKTNKGKDYFPKMHDWPLKQEYLMEIGSGIILGAFGLHGSDIDSLGFLMLRQIIGVDMSNIVYDIRAANLLPPQKKTSLDVTLANPSETDSDKSYQRVTKTKETGDSWSITTGVTFGQTYKVSAGVPTVTQDGTETKWEVSISGTYSQSWSTRNGYETSIALIAPKRKKTRITVDYFEGTLNKLPYTAQMKYSLDNGMKFYTSVRGIYDGITSTRFIQEARVVAVWDES